MRLAILGAGGFRTPLVHDAVLGAASPDADGGPLVDEITLFDTDQARLQAMLAVLRQQSRRCDTPAVLRPTTSLDEAITGADVVFCAIRVGGTAARVADERVALSLGVLGQETTGPGGLSYGLRTVPVARHIAARTAELAPHAWIVNFTNPAGMITEAMLDVLGENDSGTGRPDRVIGICDSPVAMARRAGLAAGMDPDGLRLDYAGLNHLGWLQHLWSGDVDVLPGLMRDDAALESIEESALFGVDWLRTLGSLPNEYLHYYYDAPRAVADILAAGQTRGEFLRAQQEDFYRCLDAVPAPADPLAEWDRVRRERNATYLAETRAQGQSRAEQDVVGGGYESVAVALMAALTGRPAGADRPAELVLNVPNRGAIAGLDDRAVVEVPCTVGPDGARPVPVSALPGHALGLCQQVKAVERLVISAAVTGDQAAARAAFALHPLVRSVDLGGRLLAGYRAAIPQVAAVFDR